MPENQPALDGPKPAGRVHLRYCRLVLLCLAAVAVTAIPVALTVARLRRAEPLRISEETTYITEPLKSDGKQVDYFAALQQATYPANIATDENGYRLIVRALGKSPGAEPAHFAAICQQLGLAPESIRPEVTYRDPHDFLTVYVDGEEFDKTLLDRVRPEKRSRRKLVEMLEDKLARPWTVGDLPMMAAWLEENGPALDLMVRAVRQPTFHVPMVREHEDAPLDGAAMSDLNYLRSFVHGLSARANNRIATGDIEGAVGDIIACKRLGRHIAQGATTLEMLLILLYEREHGTLPPAWSVGADGKPLHSWRVLLLPYLGQEALYANIRLDEPWDSPHNRQFHGEAVPFYRCPSDPVAGPGETTYSVVVGPDMPFEAGEGKRLADFGPHSDDMILLVERAEPACWMDPTREVPQRAAEEGIREHAEPLAPAPPSPNGIGSHHRRGAHFGLRNGAVEFLWADNDLEELRAMLRGV